MLFQRLHTETGLGGIRDERDFMLTKQVLKIRVLRVELRFVQLIAFRTDDEERQVTLDKEVNHIEIVRSRLMAHIENLETMCIVLDEPTAMLDPRGRQEVMDTIRYLNREKGITVILITHYMDEAVQADRVVVMDGGNILTDGDPRTVFAQVELLKRHKLDVPQATELIYRLNAAGCSISGTPLDEDECVKAIAEYLKLG